MINTKDMIYVHRVMRNALLVAPNLIAAAQDTDQTSRLATFRYLDSVCQFIASHHHAEDVVLWDVLKQRAPAQAALIEQGQAQHHALDDELLKTFDLLKKFKDGEDVSDPLINSFDRIRGIVLPHLDFEEKEVLPIISAHIQIEEWAQMPGQTWRRLQGDAVLMIVGLVHEQFDDEFRALMQEHMPEELRHAWVTEGQALFDKTMRTVSELA